MCQAADELYPNDPEAKKEYALRHAQFYNSHVVTALLNVASPLAWRRKRPTVRTSLTTS